MADPISLGSLASSLGLPLWAFYLVMVWSLFWKAVALWKSARLNHPFWFIIILVINTLGILEILYIFLLSDIKFNKPKINKKKQTLKSQKRK